LRDTLGNDLRIALFVTSVVAIRTLHAGSVFEELATEGAAHDVVELLLHELVAILFDDLFFTRANSALSTESDIKGCLVSSVLGWSSVSSERIMYICEN
jgi:hypothetical protein